MDDAQIVPVAPSESAEALELVFAYMDEATRRQQIETLQAGPMTPEGFWAARRAGRLVGAVYGQAQPGRSALAWPPGLIAGEPSATALALLAALDDALRRRDVAMITMLVEYAPEELSRILSPAGYAYLAELLYLVSGEDVFPASEPRSELDFEPYDSANHARLAAVLSATYHQTRDCPHLNDPRPIDDVLLGYRHTGVFDPQRWRIVRHHGEDVGCLLVTDHPAHGSCELVYMGVIAAMRGRGWGREIARYAQWLTACAARPRLVLAVDAENGPALAMYAEVGFHAWDRRNVYVRRLVELAGDDS